MSAWLKNAFELTLWFLFGRPTSKTRRRWEEEAAKLPPHPKPGRTII